MNKQLRAMYAKCRAHMPFMLVGRDAECSLDAARTILRFRELERLGLVRMRDEPEQDSYFDVYGKEDDPKEQKRMEEILDRLGCWWTCSEFWCGPRDEDGHPDGDADDDSNWEHADSCGMHTGYKNPLDPFENCYVVQEMAAAVERLEARIAAEQDAKEHRVLQESNVGIAEISAETDQSFAQ